MKEFNFFVGYTVAEDKAKGIAEHSRIIAGFDLLRAAEDFISCCLQKRQGARFFIESKEGKRLFC